MHTISVLLIVKRYTCLSLKNILNVMCYKNGACYWKNWRECRITQALDKLELKAVNIPLFF